MIKIAVYKFTFDLDSTSDLHESAGFRINLSNLEIKLVATEVLSEGFNNHDTSLPHYIYNYKNM